MNRTSFALLLLILLPGHPLFSDEKVAGILAGRDFLLHLARTPAERSRGLMEVRFLPPREGMLFLYPSDDRRQFWMKDVYIPLDILFLDRDLKILEIAAAAPPEWKRRETGPESGKYFRSPTGPFAVASKSDRVRFVLEINGGQAAALGLAPGDGVKLLRNPGPWLTSE